MTWLPELCRGDVHAWHMEIPSQDGSWLSRLESLLDQGERARAERFHRWEDARRFIAGRGLLRLMLGFYLREQPERLKFRTGPYGKPELEGSGRQLHFNLSHSDCWLALALSWEHEIGIDVEADDPKLDWQAVASGFFTQSEVDELASLPPGQARERFMGLWCRKEALYKAIGAGFAMAPDQVPLSLGQESARVSAPDMTGKAQDWTLHQLNLAPGCHAALAHRAGEVRLRIGRLEAGILMDAA